MCVECDSRPDGTGKDQSDRVKGHYDLATEISTQVRNSKLVIG